LLKKYMDETSQDMGKYYFMVHNTFKELELGAVEDVVIWENLDTERIVPRNTSTDDKTVAHLSKEQ